MKKIFGISGWSGSGKTTLVNKLINLFSSKYNFKVCAIKHAHENFDIDQKGKDTYKFAESGAKIVIASSSKKTAVIDYSQNNNTVEDVLKLSGNVDLVLVEGWKNSLLNKIEVYREIVKKPLLYKKDKNFVAVASDKTDLKLERDIILLDLNNVNEIADFIIKFSPVKRQ